LTHANVDIAENAKIVVFLCANRTNVYGTVERNILPAVHGHPGPCLLRKEQQHGQGLQHGLLSPKAPHSRAPPAGSNSCRQARAAPPEGFDNHYMRACPVF